MQLVPTTWRCDVCGRVRPDAEIAVLEKDRSVYHGLARGTVLENIRYCRDNPGCVAGARFKSHFAPFAPVDSGNEFLVGLCASGQVRIETPVPEILAPRQALNLAAWLRVVADPEGREFDRLIEEITK